MRTCSVPEISVARSLPFFETISGILTSGCCGARQGIWLVAGGGVFCARAGSADKTLRESTTNNVVIGGMGTTGFTTMLPVSPLCFVQ